MDNEKMRYFDKRTIDRYRLKGKITPEEIVANEKNLPDEAANADYIAMEYFETDFADDGDDAHRHHEEDGAEGDGDELGDDLIEEEDEGEAT